MAINTQKLLPSAKGGALVKFNAGAIAPSLSIKRKSIDVNKLALISQKRNEQNVSIVQRSLINVDTLLLKHTLVSSIERSSQPLYTGAISTSFNIILSSGL